MAFSEEKSPNQSLFLRSVLLVVTYGGISCQTPSSSNWNGANCKCHMECAIKWRWRTRFFDSESVDSCPGQWVLPSPHNNPGPLMIRFLHGSFINEVSIQNHLSHKHCLQALYKVDESKKQIYLYRRYGYYCLFFGYCCSATVNGNQYCMGSI